MGKAKRLRKLKAEKSVQAKGTTLLAGLYKPPMDSEALLPKQADFVEIRDDEAHLWKDVEISGSIFCEVCEDELTAVVETDTGDIDYLVALFVAKCPKCVTLSSQPCFTEEAASKFRAKVVEASGIDIAEHSIVSREPLKDL